MLLRSPNTKAASLQPDCESSQFHPHHPCLNHVYLLLHDPCVCVPVACMCASVWPPVNMYVCVMTDAKTENYSCVINQVGSAWLRLPVRVCVYL